uniref:Uncharacterized protein n=1 Tax=Arundo donax TaxID=35708 RepID=A0A0A8Y0Z2_ARUDO
MPQKRGYLTLSNT